MAETASQMFFIVGCGRSGTTLLQSALMAHPEVTIPPETKFYEFYPPNQWRYGNPRSESTFLKVAERVWDNQQRRGIKTDCKRFLELAASTERTWDGIFLALLTAYAEEHDAPRIGEKSPAHTHHVGHLREAFPQARFIHIVRDPRAVVLSRLQAGFQTRFIGLHIQEWHTAIEMHRRNAETLGSERYVLLRYEELVTSMEPTLRRVCDFLDLPFMDAMLKPHKRSERGFPDRSSKWMENTLKPVFTSSIERWRAELSPSRLALVEHTLREDMALMGYEPSGATISAPSLRRTMSYLSGIVERRLRRIVFTLIRRTRRVIEEGVG